MSDTKLTAEESCRQVLKSIADACDRESLARAGGYLFRYVQEETVLRDCGQRGVCRTPPGCARHWEERNRELVRENEVLRSNSDHLSSENASLASQVESMAMRIESLAEELAKPEDVRLREVLDALDGRAVIFDGLGARVGHLLDEMDEWKSVYVVVDDEQMTRVRSAMEDVTSMVDSLRLGCEIAYRRWPTQEEGDACEHRHDQSMGASHGSGECFVPMGSHHGWKCKCGTWVWGGPTVCQRCVDADAVKIAMEWKAEATRLRKPFDDAGQGEHNVLALIDHYQRNSMEADERIRAVRKLLEENGCDCPCDHHPDERGDDCEVCLACRIGEAVGK